MSSKKDNRRLIRLSAGALFLVFSVLSVTLWFVHRGPKAPEPPATDLAEVDPEVAEAITAARSKVQQQPSNGATWGRLGMIFLAHDFFAEAEVSFTQAERLDPADARWPYLCGLAVVQSDPDAGIPHLQRAAERCGKDSLAPRLRLAEALLTQGRLDEAEFHLQQARKAEPNNVRLQLGLGRLAVLRSQWRDAKEHLENCTRDVSARRSAHTLLAETWRRLGETDKARAEQRQADETSEDQIWLDPYVEDVLRLKCGLTARLQRAVDLFALKRYQQGVELLQETAQRYPKSPRVWVLLGKVWQKLDRLERAEDALAEAVRIDPDSPEGWFWLGSVQAARNRSSAAAESLRRAIRLKPDYADAHVHLGNCLKKAGDATAAADEYRAALRCRPDCEPARQALSELTSRKR